MKINLLGTGGCLCLEHQIPTPSSRNNSTFSFHRSLVNRHQGSLSGLEFVKARDNLGDCCIARELADLLMVNKSPEHGDLWQEKEVDSSIILHPSRLELELDLEVQERPDQETWYAVDSFPFASIWRCLGKPPRET